MRWAGHVERMGERRGLYSVWMGIPEGSDYLEDLREDGRKNDLQVVRW